MTDRVLLLEPGQARPGHRLPPAFTVKAATDDVDGVTKAEVRLVFDPPWDKSRMSDEVRLELGLL